MWIKEKQTCHSHISCYTCFRYSYQDLEDLEDAVRCLAPDGHSLQNFDTSCFSGKYVTGQTIGDEYFQSLHNLRNDAAKELRNNGAQSFASTTSLNRERSAVQSNNGCESVANDRRESTVPGNACEPLANNVAVR